MKKRMTAALLLAVILCAFAIPALAATYATVVGGWLRLRAAPSYDATVITSYRTGTTVTVLSESNGWARVMTPDYRLGYMDKRYLWFQGDKPQPTPKPSTKPERTWTTVNRRAWVTSQNGKGVRLRNAPEVNSYNVMGLYPVGRSVTEIKVSNDGWSYIRIDKKTGYMMSQFLTPGTKPAPPPQTQPQPGTQPQPQPQPETPELRGVRLSTQSPKVGEKMTLTVLPEGIKYSVIWIRESTMTLLSTANSYTPTAADVGSKIRIRVTGADGTVAETTTANPVAAGSTSSSTTGTTGSVQIAAPANPAPEAPAAPVDPAPPAAPAAPADPAPAAPAAPVNPAPPEAPAAPAAEQPGTEGTAEQPDFMQGTLGEQT